MNNNFTTEEIESILRDIENKDKSKFPEYYDNGTVKVTVNGLVFIMNTKKFHEIMAEEANKNSEIGEKNND